MTSLSWFLYFADVFDSLKVALSLFAGVLLFVSAVLTLVYVISGGFNKIPDSHGQKWDPETKKSISKLYKTLVVTGILSLFFAVSIPSQKTMYLIAGTEIGNVVISNPANAEILTDVQKIIKKKLSDALNESNKSQ